MHINLSFEDTILKVEMAEKVGGEMPEWHLKGQADIFTCELVNEHPVFNENILDSNLSAVLPINDFASGQKGGTAYLKFKGAPGTNVKVNANFKGIAKFVESANPVFEFQINETGEREVAIIPIRKPTTDPDDIKRGFGVGVGTVSFTITAGEDVETLKLGLFEIVAIPRRTSFYVIPSPFLNSDITQAKAGVPAGFRGVVLNGFVRGSFEIVDVPSGGGRSLAGSLGQTPGFSATNFIAYSETAKLETRSKGFEPQSGYTYLGQEKSANHNLAIATYIDLKGQLDLQTTPSIWKGTSDNTISDGSLVFKQAHSGSSFLISNETGGLVDATTSTPVLLALVAGTIVGQMLPDGKLVFAIVEGLSIGTAQNLAVWAMQNTGSAAQVRYAIQGNLGNKKDGVFAVENSGALDGFDIIAGGGGNISNGLPGFADNNGKLQVLIMDILISSGANTNTPVIGDQSPSSICFVLNALMSATRAEDNPSGPAGGDDPDEQADITLHAENAETAVRELKTP